MSEPNMNRYHELEAKVRALPTERTRHHLRHKGVRMGACGRPRLVCGHTHDYLCRGCLEWRCFCCGYDHEGWLVALCDHCYLEAKDSVCTYMLALLLRRAEDLVVVEPLRSPMVRPSPDTSDGVCGPFNMGARWLL